MRDRYFKINDGADLRLTRTHVIGGIYLAKVVMDECVWLKDGDLLTLGYYSKDHVEEVFDV